MTLQKIRIRNLRNIEEIELEFAAGTNLIWGPNGSGKSSILEAIYILGRGRSFRTRENRPLIRNGTERLDLFGLIGSGQGTTTRFGVRKEREATEARIDGNRITRVSELAKRLPLSILTPNSHEILERGPQYRRRYIDLGVFHVEPGYRDLMERYQRLLLQRNAALREKWQDTAAWDTEMERVGEAINLARERYVETLATEIKTVATRLVAELELVIEWKRGWADGVSLAQAFARTKEGDQKKGYTQVGPQRADLAVKLNREAAEKKASRGQQKLIVAAMQIAQSRMISKGTGLDTVMIVDDLAAELDAENRQKLMAELQECGAQTFITGADRSVFHEAGVEKMFHVEHGALSLA